MCIGVVDPITCNTLARIVCERPNCGSARPIADRILKRIYIERHVGILSHQTGERSLKRFDVSLPIQRDQRPKTATIRIGGEDRQSTIVDSGGGAVGMLPPASHNKMWGE